MFWRSVVGKLAVTILLLVSFVLFVLTILLLNFFEKFHIEEAEQAMMQTATKVSVMIDQYDDKELMEETIERVKDPDSRVAIVYKNGASWVSDTADSKLVKLDYKWLTKEANLHEVLRKNNNIRRKITLPNSEVGALIVGTPFENKKGAVYVYQSLDVINQTKAETTKIIFWAAGIAIILTTIFAFFLSTRITSPLMKMREAAFDLARGEFDTKVPILAYDEIGELAMAFNRMGRQLKFHLNALQHEKEQLSSIVRTMADGIITLNRKGKVLLSNPLAEHLIESLEYEQGISSNDQSIVLPEELQELFNQMKANGEEAVKEIDVQGRNWVVIMTPLYDHDYIRGAVAVIRDMTEERRLDKFRKDFIANVSHELRTPISLMQGYSEAIVDDIAESKEDKNALAQIINEESLRMSRLVNELLDIAKMESGQISINFEEVYLQEYIQKIIRKFERVAKEHHIQLILDESLEKPYILMDSDRMEQVFTNLIDNAISHTEENGHVKLHLRNNADGLTAIIEDNGSGIPEEDLPFVFERFYKADKSRVRNHKKKGTGLGLSIAKNIIEAHHGKISVKSKINEGTSFILHIPNK